MGFKTTEICYGVDIPPVPKSVLLYLAHRCNDENGDCFPAILTIAKTTGLSERAVYKQISALKECGFLSIIGSKHRSNVYKLTPLEGRNLLKIERKKKGKRANADDKGQEKDASNPAPCAGKTLHRVQVSTAKDENGTLHGVQSNPAPCAVNPAPCAPNHKYQSEINQEINHFLPHAHATAQEPDQTPSASPQEKKDLVSVDDWDLKKPTGIITTGSRSKQPERFDFRMEYFEQSKRIPEDRLVELMESWNRHKTGISKKGQWSNMHRKLFIGSIIRMENEHGTDAVCDQIEAAICGGYPGIVSPKDVSESQRKAKIEREHCQVGFDDCSDLPF